jgi:hypothetical protein
MPALLTLFLFITYILGCFITYSLVLGTFYNVYKRNFSSNKLEYEIALKIGLLSWIGYFAFVIYYRKDKEHFGYRLW